MSRSLLRMDRATSLLLAACLGACVSPGFDQPPATEKVEPDVFDVLRASNSRAAVEYLRQRHEEELEHSRLLHEEINRLMAAEEGVAQELEEHRAALRTLRKEVTATEKQRAEVLVSFQSLQQSKAVLEQQSSTVRKEIEAATAARDQQKSDLLILENEILAARKILESVAGADTAKDRAELHRLVEKLGTKVAPESKDGDK